MLFCGLIIIAVAPLHGATKAAPRHRGVSTLSAKGGVTGWPRHVQNAAFGVHLVKVQGAGVRHAQAVAEHQKQKAAVAGFVEAALGGCHELFNLARGDAFAVTVFHKAG